MQLPVETCRACAMTLAALLAMLVPQAQAQDFGRLFFSVEERLELSRMREEGVEIETPSNASTPQPKAPEVGEVIYNGRVQRSDGESTIWVNGRPVLPGSATPEGIRARSTGRTGGEIRFELPSGAGFELKVGQKIKVVTGQVVESYEAKPEGDAAPGFSGTLPGAAPASTAQREPVPGAFPGVVPPPPGAMPRASSPPAPAAQATGGAVFANPRP